MHTKLLAAALAALLLAPLAPKALAEPTVVEASFDGARLADDLSGTYSGNAGAEVRVRLYASAKTTLSCTLSPDPAGSAPIPSVSLVLVDDSGTDLNVAGGPHDKSVAGSGTIVWNKVPLPATGGYSFVLRGTGAGGWRLKIKGTAAKTAETFPSPANLAVGAQTGVDFHGLRGGTMTFSLAPTGKSLFKGSLVRVERPDGTAIDASVPPTGFNGPAKGKIPLDVDGVHHLVFKNVGSGIGAWVAKVSVAPPKNVARRGYVSAAGTALVPTVVKITPSSDYQKDDALEATLTGRDFQPGADVRLVRKGFADIVATNVSLVSETQLLCTLDLDTALTTGVLSLGTWNVAVTNAPTYSTPGDPTTIDKTTPTRDQKKTFASVASGSITLPAGVAKNTETWDLVFDADFQTDLTNMGLGASDAKTAGLARNMVETYVVCFLRDLMLQNETTGKLVAGTSPPISFVLNKMPSAAGKAGRDYDRIEIGGAWQTGDPQDANEPLQWGFAPLGVHPADLSVTVDDGMGGTTRIGYGVRTAVLDPRAVTASQDWVLAMAPLRQNPLTSADQPFFDPAFAPSTVADADRYRDIVNQTTRAAREIAALVAHHVGRAMGLAPGGQGPMANPSVSGYLWPTTAGLTFANSDVATLLANARLATLPGKSATLKIRYFPLLSTQPSLLPDATAGVDYAVSWTFVGGRADALPTDYAVSLASDIPILSDIPLLGNAAATINGLSITGSPVYVDATQGLPYAGIAILQVVAADTVRGGAVALYYRLNVFPNFAQLPTSGIVYQRAVNLQQYIRNN